MNELTENLAARKSFSELSQTEREAVLAGMSREAYEHLRAILLAAPALDAGPPPPPELRDRLLARMQAPAPSRRPARMLTMRLPVWQAAAMAIAVAAAVWLLKAQNVRHVIVPVTEIRTDTLYREKIVWKERVVVREKTVFREAPAAAAFASEKTALRDAVPEEIPAPTFAEPPATGTSLKDEPVLMDFFVQTE